MGGRSLPSLGNLPPILYSAPFLLAAFTGACLLFWIQPLFGKMALPLLGGSPQVWNTAMVFFQGALLLGYGYAHLLARLAPARAQILIHSSFLAAAYFLSLPVGIPEAWSPDPAAHPSLELLLLLGKSLGVPFVALSATAPLVQHWYASSDAADREAPYFLYSASNLGSVLALLLFPFVLEPTFSATEQAGFWAFGFILFGAVLLVSGWVSAKSSHTPLSYDASRTPAVQIVWRQRGAWLIYSILPVALLLGVTTHLTTDITPAPFLWVVPFVLYLLAFANAFANCPWISARSARRASFLLLPALALAFDQRSLIGVTMPLHLLVFFALTLCCASELARRRPAPERLTEFYLTLSIGGVLGGVLVTFLAPAAFDTLLEYPLTLVLIALCMIRPTGQREPHLLITLFAVGAGAMALSLFALDRPFAIGAWLPPGLVVLSYLLTGILRIVHIGLAVAVMLFVAVMAPTEITSVWRDRSFFGSYAVRELPDQAVRELTHGTTLHGGQFEMPNGTVHPTAYYTSSSPGVELLLASQSAVLVHRVALIGIGSGAMSYYRRAGDVWRYFEIDPVIAWLATESGHFRMMPEFEPNADIVLGDARLTLSREDSASFDVIVIDAFSSDAVPSHLLTLEALALYESKLRLHGVLLLHISNNYLDLEPVIHGAVHQLGMHGLAGYESAPHTELDPHGQASLWYAAARTRETLANLSLSPRWRGARASESYWTDDFSNLFRAIDWGRGRNAHQDSLSKPDLEDLLENLPEAPE